MGGRWSAYSTGNTKLTLIRKSRGRTYTRGLSASESEMARRNARNNSGYTQLSFNDGSSYKNVKLKGSSGGRGPISLGR